MFRRSRRRRGDRGHVRIAQRHLGDGHFLREPERDLERSDGLARGREAAVALHAQAPNAIEEAYKKAFVKTNEELHERTDIDDSMSGTTGICCLFSKGTLYVANVGDSRAVIGEERNGKLIAFPLSSDQTCAAFAPLQPRGCQIEERKL